MKSIFALAALATASMFFPSTFSVAPAFQQSGSSRNTSAAYLGFDRNDYPGDQALPDLRPSFSFSGYWLNDPPGENANSWQGKRSLLSKLGFGFLVLFNGRLDKQLARRHDAAALGAGDAQLAISAARREGFPPHTIIFLDQEEGGRLLPEQKAYLFAWVDAIVASDFRAGVYCSGMPASEGHGQFVITANDIREHAGDRKIAFFVYNDVCPPSSGCVYPPNPPQPAQSGLPFASVWQFAQSPRRKEFTVRCSAAYNRDGNCYPPSMPGGNSIYLDLDSATSPDPSKALP